MLSGTVLVPILWLGLSAGKILAQESKLTQSVTRATEIKSRLDRQFLPDGTRDLTIDEKQTFDLVVHGRTQLTLVSVLFTVTSAESAEQSAHHCGVYLLEPNNSAEFFSPVSDPIPIQC
jgi:hypothetical protein